MNQTIKSDIEEKPAQPFVNINVLFKKNTIFVIMN